MKRLERHQRRPGANLSPLAFDTQLESSLKNRVENYAVLRSCGGGGRMRAKSYCGCVEIVAW